MSIHSFASQGTLVLVEHSEAAAGSEKKMTRRLELKAEGEQVVMRLTIHKDDGAVAQEAARRVVPMRAEDLFALIEAYVAIAY